MHGCRIWRHFFLRYRGFADWLIQPAFLTGLTDAPWEGTMDTLHTVSGSKFQKWIYQSSEKYKFALTKSIVARPVFLIVTGI